MGLKKIFDRLTSRGPVELPVLLGAVAMGSLAAAGVLLLLTPSREALLSEVRFDTAAMEAFQLVEVDDPSFEAAPPSADPVVYDFEMTWPQAAADMHSRYRVRYRLGSLANSGLEQVAVSFDNLEVFDSSHLAVIDTGSPELAHVPSSTLMLTMSTDGTIQGAEVIGADDLRGERLLVLMRLALLEPLAGLFPRQQLMPGDEWFMQSDVELAGGSGAFRIENWVGFEGHYSYRGLVLARFRFDQRAEFITRDTPPERVDETTQRLLERQEMRLNGVYFADPGSGRLVGGHMGMSHQQEFGTEITETDGFRRMSPYATNPRRGLIWFKIGEEPE